MTDSLWQILGAGALAVIGWLQVKSWRRGREIDALKRGEAERKTAEADMVNRAIESLERERSGKAPPVDTKKRDYFSE